MNPLFGQYYKVDGERIDHGGVYAEDNNPNYNWHRGALLVHSKGVFRDPTQFKPEYTEVLSSRLEGSPWYLQCCMHR